MSSGVRHVTQADCAQPSIGAIQDALREQASKKRPGEWVQGFNFDDTKTSENRFLNRADLDAVSREHPIFVAHRAGLVYYFNSKALEAAGYNRDTQPPPGGYLEKAPATGELTGVIYQHAAEWVERELIPWPTDDDRRNGLKFIMDMYAKAGATTVHDAMVSADEFRVYQEARQNGKLPLRVYLLMHHSHFPALRDAGVRSGFGDDRLRFGGIKISVDGGIASRTAYLSRPYEGSDDDRGFLAVGPEETERKVMEWHRSGFQICIHANGDSAIEQVLTAYEKAQAEYPRTGTPAPYRALHRGESGHPASHEGAWLRGNAFLHVRLLPRGEDAVLRKGARGVDVCPALFHRQRDSVHGRRRLPLRYVPASHGDPGLRDQDRYAWERLGPQPARECGGSVEDIHHKRGLRLV